MMHEIILDNGEKATSIATLNDGYTDIIVDDGCYVIVNGGIHEHADPNKKGRGKFSAWIFKEALVVLKTLPENPNDALENLRNGQCG